VRIASLSQFFAHTLGGVREHIFFFLPLLIIDWNVFSFLTTANSKKKNQHTYFPKFIDKKMEAPKMEAPKEEMKASFRDFAGTYWVSIPLPSLEQTIRTWVITNLKDGQRILDANVCKNCFTVDPHISVLLGLPTPPNEEFITLLATTRPFQLEFGLLKAFELESKVVHGTIHKYQVLYIEVIINAQLIELQEKIGKFHGGLKWHHPKYNSHITVAFVKEGVAEKFVNQSIFSSAAITAMATAPNEAAATAAAIVAATSAAPPAPGILVQKLAIKKYQDKIFAPMIIELG
jgi:hypothetical protein